MLEAQLSFNIEVPFNITTNEPLRKLCQFKLWDKGNQKNLYSFDIKDLEKVQQLVGIPINLPPIHAEIASAQIEGWKGKSGYLIRKVLDQYEISSYQKSYKEGKPYHVIALIPKANVELVFKILNKYELGSVFEFKDLTKEICTELKLTRFFRESGSFDHEKFFGTRCPHEYGKYYYFPIKVLEHLGIIQHRSRWVTLLKDKFTSQTRLV